MDEKITTSAEDAEQLDVQRRKLLKLGTYIAPAIIGSLLVPKESLAQGVSCGPATCLPNTEPCSPATCKPRA